MIYLFQDIPKPPESSVEAWMLYVFAVAILGLFLFIIKLIFIIIGLVKETTKVISTGNEVEKGLTTSIDKHNDLLTKALAKGLRRTNND